MTEPLAGTPDTSPGPDDVPMIYRCAGCGGTFVSLHTPEDARDEFHARFGENPEHPDPAQDPGNAIVCEVCYRHLMGGALS